MAYPWISSDQLDATDLDAIAVANLQQLTAIESITAGAAVAPALYQATNIALDFKAIAQLTTSGVNTISKTVGSNSNRVLVVFLNCRTSGSQSTASLTWNGVAPDTEYNTVDGSNGLVHVAVWIAPGTGAHNLVITTTNMNTTGSFYAMYSLYNCKQTSPIDNHAQGTATTGSNSLTVSADGAIGLSYIATAEGGGLVGTVSGTGYAADTQTATNGSNASAASGDSTLAAPLGAGSSVTIQQSAAVNMVYSLITILPANAVVAGVQNASSAAAVTLLNARAAFIGFANASVSAGQNLVVTVGGIVSGLSGLTIGTPYYLNNTNGTIGTSAGSVSRKVGVALNSTTLLITNIW